MDEQNENSNSGLTPEWIEKVANLPARMETITKAGTEASSELHKVEIVKDSVRSVVFDDQVVLNTNDAKSDTKPDRSSAMISIPIETQDKIKAKTTGNASVSIDYPFPNISLFDGMKKLKSKSESGMFATVRIRNQRDGDHDYFDVYFGEDGRRETVGPNGVKDRPHISFFPDANLKYVRLNDYRCQLSGELEFDREKNELSHAKSIIQCLVFEENLTLTFDLNTQKNILVLVSIEFTTVS